MPILENSQHEKFVQELVKGKGQGEAYLAAGYKAKSVSVASAAATRLLKDVKISGRLTELQEMVQQKTVLTKAWVIDKLIENVERAMTAVPVLDRKGVPTGEYVYEGSVANRALELLGKEQGMFVDRKEVGKPGDFADMSDDELSELIQTEAQELLGSGSTKH